MTLFLFFCDFLIAILLITYTTRTHPVWEKEKNLLHTLQAYVHGDEGCAEDQQQNSDLNDAGRVSGRSEDPRGVSEPGA